MTTQLEQHRTADCVTKTIMKVDWDLLDIATEIKMNLHLERSDGNQQMEESTAEDQQQDTPIAIKKMSG